MKNVCWIHELIDYGRKLLHFVWCWSFHMKTVSEEYVNKSLPPCCIVTTVTCSSDMRQWPVSLTVHGFWDKMLCHWVSPENFNESRIPLLGPLKPWQWNNYIPLKHQEKLVHWHITSQKTWIFNSTAVRTQTSQGASLLYTNIANRGFMKCGSLKFVAWICRTLYICAVL
jgi:hypothetical protein